MKVLPLDDFSIEEYSRDLSPDHEFFVEEENELKRALGENEDALADFKNQDNKLGVKQDPGDAPELSDYYEDFLTPVFQWTFWPWVVGVVLVFVLHCVIWLLNFIFNIPWDTWGWTKWVFLWGLIVVAGISAINLSIYGVWYLIWYIKHRRYLSWKTKKDFLKKQIRANEKQIKEHEENLGQLINNRERILLFAFRNFLGFPLKSFERWNYENAKKEYFKKTTQLATLDKNNGIDDIYNYYDEKLYLFYKYSIPVETDSAEALRIFSSSIPVKNRNMMNREYKEPLELSDQAFVNLKNHNDKFGENTLDADTKKFKEFLDQDTEGFFTKHSSSLLQRQVDGLENVYKSAAKKVDNYNKVISQINVTLSLSRLVAFRNIYLGAELVNIIRESAGGGKATVQNDIIETTILAPIKKMKNVNFTTSQAVSEMLAAGLSSIESFITDNLSMKQFQNYGENSTSNMTLGIIAAGAFGVINAGIEAWKKRNEKIEALLKKEKVIMENMEKMVDGYLEQLKVSKRGLEVIRSLSKVNNGFIKVYTPLYEKVFIKKDIKSVTVIELQQLCLALNEFNKLSQTKL